MTTKDKQIALSITSRFEKFIKRLGIVLYIITALFVIGSVIYAGFSIYRYVTEHNFLWRSPVEIKLQTPLEIVKKRTVVLEEVQKSLESQNTSKFKVSAKEIEGKNENGVITAGESLDQKLERVYDVIHLHESGNGSNRSGLHGYCLSKGMVNSVGYAPAENYCFSNEKEQKETVILWFKNRLGKDCVKRGFCFDTVEEGLKVYNGGSYTL